MPIYKINGKKDSKQKYRVVVSYKNQLGENKQAERIVYGATEAKEEEARLKTELKETSPDKKITLQQLYDEYIETKSHQVRETYLEKIKEDFEYHILPILKNKKLSQLTPLMLQNWKNKVNEKDLKISTKRNIYASLRACLNYAVTMGYITVSNLFRVGNFKDAYEMPNIIEKKEYYTAKEFFKFIAVAKEQAEEKGLLEWNYYVFFYIAFYTGMRKGEINALRWSNIENGIIHVREGVSQKLKGGDRKLPPKNKPSYRSLQIPEPLKKVLDEQYERHKGADGFSDDWFVCGGLRTLRDTTIENRNQLYGKTAGLHHIKIHGFRHSHVSVLANARINIQEVARRLGHSKIEITWNTYSHMYPREEEIAVETLNKLEKSWGNHGRRKIKLHRPLKS